MWIPKRWDLSLNALAQYTVPKLPAENEWIDRSRIKPRRSSTSLSQSSSTSTAPDGRPIRNRRRPPTRRLIRHVLRARVEAAKALASLFAQLERSADTKRVCASPHLARAFGGQVEEQTDQVDTEEGVEALAEPVGWRSAREVAAFLRKKGARVAALEDRIEGDWAAISEGDSDAFSGSGREDDIVWVATG